MILNKKQKINKEALLEELAKEDLQTLSLAYIYAKNLQMYGEDVTKAIVSATANVAMLDKAYRKGYYDGMNRASQFDPIADRINKEEDYDCMACAHDGDSNICSECENGSKYFKWR